MARVELFAVGIETDNLVARQDPADHMVELLLLDLEPAVQAVEAEDRVGFTDPPQRRQLAVEMGGEPVIVAEQDRPAYAEAVAAAAELSRAVVRNAVSGLAGLGIDEAERIVGGIVRASIEEALRAPGGDALDLGGDPSL